MTQHCNNNWFPASYQTQLKKLELRHLNILLNNSFPKMEKLTLKYVDKDIFLHTASNLVCLAIFVVFGMKIFMTWSSILTSFQEHLSTLIWTFHGTILQSEFWRPVTTLLIAAEINRLMITFNSSKTILYKLSFKTDWALYPLVKSSFHVWWSSQFPTQRMPLISYL